GAPVFDPTRERAVLKRVVDLVANEDYQPAVAQVFTTIMNQAKQLERKKLC
ncbi:chorismate mutase, partial [Limosilactobacillus fermentum]|nr:chorismate mutase [Limosilactobacillus fermentum]